MTTRENTAMILAAGLGTRLKEFTRDKPKALVEINGKPLLQHTIDNLIANGFHNIVINVHHFADQIITFINRNQFDAEILISDERDLLMDTGGGIIKASPLFHNSKAVLIHNVDIISNVNLNAITQQFIDSDDDAWLLTQNRETTRKLLFNEKQQLIGWKNKFDERYKWVNGPCHSYHEMAFSGMHIFRSNLFTSFDKKPMSVIDLYLNLAQKNRIVSHSIHPDFWFDLGKAEQIEDIERQLKDNNSLSLR